jgi:hypothetical protein
MNNRAEWNHYIKVVSGSARLVSPGSTLPALCLEFSGHPKIRQRIQRRICDQVDTAAMTAVTTIRSTPFDVFLTPEAKATVTTVARNNADRCFIDEFHLWVISCIKNKKPRNSGAS